MSVRKPMALDLATRYGIAIGTREEILLCDSIDLLEYRPGRACCLRTLELHLEHFVHLYEPTEIVVERPWVSGDDAATQTLIRYAAVAELLAYRHGLPYREISAPDVRAGVSGKASADKSDVVRTLESWGQYVVDGNAADALALLAYRLFDAEHPMSWESDPRSAYVVLSALVGSFCDGLAELLTPLYFARRRNCAWARRRCVCAQVSVTQIRSVRYYFVERPKQNRRAGGVVKNS